MTDHPAEQDDSASYHREHAFVAYKSGDYEAALRHLKRLHEVDPADPHVLYYIDRSQGRTSDFAMTLQKLDGGMPRRRIFILGCGRSGTWLATAMMTCFEDGFVLLKEVPVGRFTRIDAPERTHVLKRESDSHETACLIPETIGLLYVLRFPLDVLVSPHVDIKYYISVERWIAEIQALRRLYENKRTNMYVVRYEGLVAHPDREQGRVGQFFGLTPARPFSRFHESFTIEDRVAKAMNGIRRPENSSIERWRQNAEYRDYCQAMWPRIEADVRWVCETFGYALPNFGSEVDAALHPRRANE